MRIEEGGYYRTRGGLRLGPAKFRNYGTEYFEFDGPHASMHHPDGRYAGKHGDFNPDLDLVAEWPENNGCSDDHWRRGSIGGRNG